MDPEAARAFWSTIAQIAGVFIIPLVLEARRAVARWQGKARAMQIREALFYYLSAFALTMCVSNSLLNLAFDSAPSEFERIFWPFVLAVISFALVVVPLSNYAAIATHEGYVIATRFLPWSSWRSNRRRYHRAALSLAAASRSLRESRDTLAGSLDSLKKSTKEVRRHVQWMRGLTPAERAAAWAESTAGLDDPNVTDELRAQAVAAAEGDDDLFDKAKASIKSAKKHLRALDREMVNTLKLADEVEADRQRFTSITFVTPELREATNAAISAIEADARGVIASADDARVEAEAEQAKAEKAGGPD
jgi:hypothetical protein